MYSKCLISNHVLVRQNNPVFRNENPEPLIGFFLLFGSDALDVLNRCRSSDFTSEKSLRLNCW